MMKLKWAGSRELFHRPGGNSQRRKDCQTRVSPGWLAGAGFHIEVDATLGTESTAFFAAQWAAGQCKKSLLPHQRREVNHISTVEASRQFFVAELHLTAKRALRRESDRELTVKRERIFFQAASAPTDQFATDRTGKQEFFSRAQMSHTNLQGNSQTVFCLAILSEQSVKLLDFLDEVDFDRESLNIIDRNFHGPSCFGRTIYYETGENATRITRRQVILTLDHRNWISYEKRY
jgi:hypothetical protein